MPCFLLTLPLLQVGNMLVEAGLHCDTNQLPGGVDDHESADCT